VSQGSEKSDGLREFNAHNPQGFVQRSRGTAQVFFRIQCKKMRICSDQT